MWPALMENCSQGSHNLKPQDKTTLFWVPQNKPYWSHILNTIITLLNSALPCLSPLPSGEKASILRTSVSQTQSQLSVLKSLSVVFLATLEQSNPGFPLFTSPIPQRPPLPQQGCGRGEGLSITCGRSLTSVLRGKLYPSLALGTVKSAHAERLVSSFLLNKDPGCYNQ